MLRFSLIPASWSACNLPISPSKAAIFGFKRKNSSQKLQFPTEI